MPSMTLLARLATLFLLAAAALPFAASRSVQTDESSCEASEFW